MNKREWMLQAALAIPQRGTDGTGDHVCRLSALYDKIVAATTDEGWVEHRGEKPYPEGRVVVRQRSGLEFETDSDDVFWDHQYADADIIAWRPARG